MEWWRCAAISEYFARFYTRVVIKYIKTNKKVLCLTVAVIYWNWFLSKFVQWFSGWCKFDTRQRLHSKYFILHRRTVHALRKNDILLPIKYNKFIALCRLRVYRSDTFFDKLLCEMINKFCNAHGRINTLDARASISNLLIRMRFWLLIIYMYDWKCWAFNMYINEIK